MAQPPVSLLCLVATGALLLVVPASAETWYESYHKAEVALENESWGEALHHLNLALEQKPNSSANIRTYGMRFIQYFPFLKLGVAYYHLGQVEAALQAFDTEERLGEIGQSGDDLAVLHAYRNRIQREQTGMEAERERRARDVVSESLVAARRLEEEGKLEDALSSIAEVLAVAPDHAEAGAAQRRLRALLAEQQRLREQEERLVRLLRQGRAELQSGSYRQAAASFSEALEARPDNEIKALLEQAQGRLRAELEDRQDSTQRQRFVAQSLLRAAELERAGELGESLAELQAVLALDPRNQQARSSQARLIAAQAAAEESGRNDVAILQLLSEAEEALAAGVYQQALRKANRVLVVDPANAGALELMTRAYARFSVSLLAPDDIPPAIVLDGDQLEARSGASVRVVRSPEIFLTGSVYDSTPVEIAFLADGESVGQATVHGRELQGLWITDFRWQHRIPAGLSSVDVVAVDVEGNRATVQYTAKYVVPFLRSLWFPASLAGGLVSLVLGLAVIRACRRRRRLRERFNPYVAGAPILEHARFFGRQQLLDYVLRRIYNNNIMLYGERRIGKTSFQHQLKRCLSALEDPKHEFYPVFIDLQGTPQEKFFATLAAEVFHELAPKLEGLQPQTAPGQDAYGYRDFVKDIHHVLGALKRRTNKKVKLVLLIDEVDELNDYDPRINQRLRSLFMRAFADNLVTVVSGVGIKKQWEREGSPWYNFFQEIEVKPLDEQEARSLIEAPVRGVFAFEEGVTAEIVRRTASKPYLIQRLCTGLVDRMHEEQRRRITVADVEAACQVEGL